MEMASKAALKKAEKEINHKNQLIMQFEAKDAARNRRNAVIIGFLIGALSAHLIWGLFVSLLVGVLFAAVVLLIIMIRQFVSRGSGGSHRDSDSTSGRGSRGIPWMAIWFLAIGVLVLLNVGKFFVMQAAEPEVQSQEVVQVPISTDPNVEPTMVATDECTTQAITSFMARAGARYSDGEVVIGDKVDWAESGTKPDTVEYLFGKAQQNNMLVGEPDIDLYVPVQVLKNPLAMEVDEADGQRVSITMQPGEVMWAYVDSCVPVQENTLHLNGRTGAYFD